MADGACGRDNVNIFKFALIALLVLLAGCQHRRPWESFEKCRAGLPAESRQAVVVDWSGSPSTGSAIRLYERGDSGWKQVDGTIPAVAGRNGFAPAGEKREGDGLTPSGVFPLERGFGYEPFPARLSYLVLTPEMIWIDDPRSGRYNMLSERDGDEGFSFEVMRRDDDLYKYGIVVEYNTKEIVPGAGSAIFFHIWRDPATPTAGCVAAAEPDIVRLLGWLDPAQHPLAVLGDACP
jgi:L,D-peptidoglycan transpeptidase YkuD (ErfK/YbiS/YcfS/YnhG family)